MQKETQWRLLMLIRLYQLVKPEFLPPLLLNLNVPYHYSWSQCLSPLSCSLIFGSRVCHASLSKLFININPRAVTLYSGFLLAKCQVVIDIWGKVSWSKLYGIGHVLSKNVFYETPKSSMEQSFKAGYVIKLDKTFEFRETKFQRVVWA